MLAEPMLGPPAFGFDEHEQSARTDLEGRLDALGEPLTSFRFDLDAIHHGLDVVHLVSGQAEGVLAFLLEHLSEVDDLAVDPGSNESLLLEPFGNLAMKALSPPDY